MTVLINKHRPMLRGVRVLVDLLRDHLSKPRLLSEPLASQSAYGMPAYLDEALFPVDVSLAGRNDIGLVPKAE